MSACDISFTLDGSKPFSDVLAKFRDKRGHDSQGNGHADGYSGDFQTVNEVLNHSDKIFDSLSAAQDYCLKHAQKWENVIAVKYRIVEKEIKPNKTQEKLTAKAKTLSEEIRGLSYIAHNNYVAMLERKRVINCGECKSRLNAKFLRKNSMECPLCKVSLASKGEQRKIDTLSKQFEKAREKSKAITDKIYAKMLAESKQTKWLVCGWGAC